MNPNQTNNLATMAAQISQGIKPLSPMLTPIASTPPPQPPTARLPWTNIDFFKACQALQTNKDLFIDKRPSEKEAVRMLSEIIGRDIPKNTIKSIKDATGITWHPRVKRTVRVRAKTHTGVAKNTGRVLANAIANLYELLGQPLPDSLAKLKQAFIDGNVKELVRDMQPDQPTA